MMARYLATENAARIVGGRTERVHCSISHVIDRRVTGVVDTGGGGDNRKVTQVPAGSSGKSRIPGEVYASPHHSYVRIAKIAVAFAIIRSTPAGITAEEHTRNLCGRFQEAQLRWKESGSRLKHELLMLRQQLLRARLGPEWDQHNEPSSSAGSQQDGQPLFTQEDEDPLFPTPPCSSENPDPPTTTTTLTHHVTFLHTFLQLRTLDTTPGRTDIKEWETHTKETVFKAIDELRAALRPDSPFLCSPELLQRAAHTLVRYAESGAASFFWPQLSEAIGHLLQGVLLTILTAVDINQTKRHEDLRRFILVFGTCTCLRASVLRLLIHYITEYGHFLRRVTRGKCTLEPAAFEGMQHVLWCAERVLLQGGGNQEEGVGGKGLGWVDGAELRAKLEDCLLHISEEFPLFALYVWQIIGLL